MPISTLRGSKITTKVKKFEIKSNSGHFEALSLAQHQFFEKYFTFWKGHFYVNSKMPIFYEILNFFQSLDTWIFQRDILNQKICLKLKVRPPAEQKLAFSNFSDNAGKNILGIFRISPFFKNYSSDENVDFGLSVYLNRISISIWEGFIDFQATFSA